MAILIIGNSGTVAEVEDTTRALRVVKRPIDYGTLGIYHLALTSGTMAAGLAAGSEVFQFRWTDATNLCAVKQIRISAGGTATAFAAGAALIDAIMARSYTASGSGGTAATLSGNNAKLRTSMGTSLVGDARISSTAALTAGTRTLDAQAFASVSSSVIATAGTPIMPPTDLLFAPDESEHPIILAQNEGFVLRATVPATGTWTLSVQVKWAELAAYT